VQRVWGFFTKTRYINSLLLLSLFIKMTDGQTDRIAISISRVSVRDKNSATIFAATFHMRSYLEGSIKQETLLSLTGRAHSSTTVHSYGDKNSFDFGVPQGHYFLAERHYVTLVLWHEPSVCSLSVTVLQILKFSAIFLRRLIA